MQLRRSSSAAIAAGLLFTSPICTAQSAPAESVRDWMDSLSGPINRISQTTGDWAQQRQIEERVAAKVRERIKADPEHPGLVDKTKGGSTVLMHASLNGYALVVEALLESPAVRRELEASNSTGATAWILSNFAWKQAAWVCAPSILDHDNPFSAAQYIIQSQYYTKAPESPYVRIRNALAGAGARQDLQAAKNAWLANCPPAKPEVIARVRASEDLLQSLLLEADASLANFQSRAAGASATRR